MEGTNPAARLHAILSQAQLVGGGSAFEIWRKVFDIPVIAEQARNPLEADLEAKIEVTSRVIQLKKLIDDTEESLHLIDGLPDRYFRPFQRIRQIIPQSISSMQTDLSGNLAQITEGDMTTLEFCSERLEAQHAEPIVDDDELQEILQDVNTLFDEVRSSETIHAELKSFVLDGLEAIRRGINEFRIRGPERLKEALGEVIGSLAVNQGIVKAQGNEETVGKFEKLCYRFAAAVSFASDSVGLLAAMKVGLLPSGG